MVGNNWSGNGTKPERYGNGNGLHTQEKVFILFLARQDPMKETNFQVKRRDPEWNRDIGGNGLALLYLPNLNLNFPQLHPDSPIICIKSVVKVYPSRTKFVCSILQVEDLPLTETFFVLPESTLDIIDFTDLSYGRPVFEFNIIAHFICQAFQLATGENYWLSIQHGYIGRNRSREEHAKMQYLVTYPIIRRGEHPEDHTIISRIEAWNFLTCYTESELSFRFYTNPFDLEVWLFVFVALTIFTILTDIFVRRSLKLVVKSSLFFFIGAFLEETSSIPSKLERHSVFRLGVGP